MAARPLLAGVFALALVVLAPPVVAHPGAEKEAEMIGQLIAERPDEQRLYILRGSAYSDGGHFELARADLEKAESLGERHLVAFQLGVLHYRLKDLAAARAYLDTHLEHSPRDAAGLEYRARVLRDAGEFRASLDDYAAFLKARERPNPGHFLAVARMLAELEGEGAEFGVAPAIESLDRGMARLGVIPQLQRFAIALELRRGRPKLAIARQRTMEEMLGASPEWKLEMGELLMSVGKRDEAASYFDEAAVQLAELRLTPARQSTLEELQRLRARLDRDPE